MLIVSPTEFNLATQLPMVLPITSGGDFTRRPGFAVALSGTKTTGIVRCDQPRVLDLGARHGQRIERLPDDLLEEVLARVATLFG